MKLNLSIPGYKDKILKSATSSYRASISPIKLDRVRKLTVIKFIEKLHERGMLEDFIVKIDGLALIKLFEQANSLTEVIQVANHYERTISESLDDEEFSLLKAAFKEELLANNKSKISWSKHALSGAVLGAAFSLLPPVRDSQVTVEHLVINGILSSCLVKFLDSKKIIRSCKRCDRLGELRNINVEKHSFGNVLFNLERDTRTFQEKYIEERRTEELKAFARS